MRLAAGRERAVEQGHPWVYSGAIERVVAPQGAPAAGDAAPAGLVRLETARGEALGWGLWNPRSQIRVRCLDRGEGPIDAAWFESRIRRAMALRAALVGPDTDGYRVVNAEGDGLPGFVVDRFGEALVTQVTCAGLEAVRDLAYRALGACFPGAAIQQSNDLPSRRLEGLPTDDEWIAGTPRAEAAFRERGFALHADLEGGQKTGHYCDQRENRAHVEARARGRRVADLFAHRGAFGLAALRGGAAEVVFVESSPGAIAAGQRELARNGWADPQAPGPARWARADAFAWLREVQPASLDLVVCDPPPLARRRDDVERAARAYKDLNRLALRALAPGGLLYTFTCSGAIDGKLFRQILFAAALESGAPARLLGPLGAGPDHPVSIHHPEGEYLKGWWLAV